MNIFPRIPIFFLFVVLSLCWQFRSIRKIAEGKAKSGVRESTTGKDESGVNSGTSHIKIPYLGKKRRYKIETKEFSGQVMLSLF